MLRLISATSSPYARKVRIALAEKGLPFALETEVPWHAATATPRHNPLEKLPVLITEDGASFYDSRFILQVLEAKHPAPPLFPAGLDQRLQAMRLEVLCDGVCDALVLMFFERMRGPERASAEWIARQRRKIEGGMAEIARLVAAREWAVGDGFSLGDIAAGTAAGYVSLRFPDFDWRGMHPGYAAYSDRIEQRPSFRASVPAAQAITEKVV